MTHGILSNPESRTGIRRFLPVMDLETLPAQPPPASVFDAFLRLTLVTTLCYTPNPFLSFEKQAGRSSLGNEWNCTVFKTGEEILS
ncbi:MAG TPA: hypothetical protein VJ022_10705 [Anaerolineales bacterium]|nr:hypothetical protein [Anaerolineales bacterium]